MSNDAKKAMLDMKEMWLLYFLTVEACNSEKNVNALVWHSKDPYRWLIYLSELFININMGWLAWMKGLRNHVGHEIFVYS